MLSGAAALMPTAVLRAIDRVRARRFVARVTPLHERFAAERGRAVLHGPFAGLVYPQGMEQTPKLAGTYEREIHAAVEELIALQPAVVVNVGCGEGYYANGLALRLPAARIDAHDLDDGERARCAAVAGCNGVEDRVAILGLCDVDRLRTLPRHGVALFLDCEGAELELLRPDLVPAMARWPILVELHDFGEVSASEEIPRRFAATHDVRRIAPCARTGSEARELSSWPADDRRLALDEYRPPGKTSWAWMVPR
jgi:hypothetical protein